MNAVSFTHLMAAFALGIMAAIGGLFLIVGWLDRPRRDD